MLTKYAYNGGGRQAETLVPSVGVDRSPVGWLVGRSLVRSIDRSRRRSVCGSSGDQYHYADEDDRPDRPEEVRKEGKKRPGLLFWILFKLHKRPPV